MAESAAGTRRRNLTFLVVDQVGSTAQIERLGDERAAEIRSELYDLVGEPVSRFDGSIFHYSGDGLMASFASATDAVWAGVAMQLDVQATAADRAPGEDIEIRVGLHTGESILTESGHFVGVAVHIAARLCDVAEGNEVAISDDVREMLGPHSFDLRSKGPQQMKGISHPVEVHVVDLDRASVPKPRGRARALTRVAGSGLAGIQALPSSPLVARLVAATDTFVGRKKELRSIDEAWAETCDGARTALLVAAEAGGGKSTLIARSVERIRADPEALILVGRCDPRRDLAFRAFREALGPVIDELPLAILSDHFARHGDALGNWFPALGQRLSITSLESRSDEMAGNRLLEAAVDIFDRVCAVRPVLLVLEDLHWATTGTLRLLLHLHRAPRPGRLMILGSFRPTDIDESFAGMLAELWREPGASRLDLPPLDRDDVAELMHAWLHGDLDREAVPALATRVHRDTGGRAFFATEIVRHLSAHPAEISTDADSLPIPSSVVDVVIDRIDHLPEPTPAILTMAAVVGQSFDLDVLISLVDVDEEAVIGAVEHAMRAGVVVESTSTSSTTTGVDRLEFSHALIPAALEGQLSGMRRRRLHAQIADAILDLRGDDLAHHAVSVLEHLRSAGASDRLDDAVRMVDLGTEEAHAAVAYDDAVRIALTGKELIAAWSGVEDPRWTDVTLRLAQSLNLAGRVEDATVEFAAAATPRADKKQLTLAALGHGGYLPGIPPLDPIGIDLIERALEVTDDPIDRGRLLARLAERRHIDLEYSGRLALIEEAEDLVRADEEALASVLVSRCKTLHGPIDVERNLEAADEIRRIVYALGDDVLVYGSHDAETVYAGVHGDFSRAAASANAARKIGDRLRQPEFQRHALMFDSFIASARGEYDRAHEARRTLKPLLTRGQHSQHEIIDVSLQIPSFWLQGRTEDLYAVFAAAPKYPHLLQAWMAAENGSHDATRMHLDRGETVDDLVRDQSFSFWQGACALTFAASALGDRDLAGSLLEATEAYQEQTLQSGLVMYLGDAHLLRGVLSRVIGRHDAADAHFRTSVERHEALGFRPIVALAAAEWSISLIERGADGDRDRADELAARARGIADELGLQLVLDRLPRSQPTR